MHAPPYLKADSICVQLDCILVNVGSITSTMSWFCNAKFLSPTVWLNIIVYKKKSDSNCWTNGIIIGGIMKPFNMKRNSTPDWCNGYLNSSVNKQLRQSAAVHRRWSFAHSVQTIRYSLINRGSWKCLLALRPGSCNLLLMLYRI